MIKPMIYGELKEEPEQIACGTHRGLDYYILSFGAYPTAYLDVTGTIFAGKDCEELEYVQCHGGVTYSDRQLKTVDKKGWFIGWDYAHGIDFIFTRPGFYWGKQWSVEEIVADCKNVIDRLEKRRRAELTKNGFKLIRNNPFDRAKEGYDYYIPCNNGKVLTTPETYGNGDDQLYYNAAYLNDKDFASQMALKWLLNRKLEKYAWDNEAEDCAWDNENEHYSILYTPKDGDFFVGSSTWIKQPFAVYFSKGETAEKAIEDVVEPFMTEHPKFKW